MADFLLEDEIENQPEKTTVEFAKFGLRLRAALHRGYRWLFPSALLDPETDRQPRQRDPVSTASVYEISLKVRHGKLPEAVAE